MTSTFTFRRAASWSTLNSAERLNHWSVSWRSAISSRATSYRIADSERPCVSRSTKLNTNALIPSGAIAFASRRSSSSASYDDEILSYLTGTLCLSSSELRLEQLALVRVERLVLALAPPVGKARRDLVRERVR